MSQAMQPDETEHNPLAALSSYQRDMLAAVDKLQGNISGQRVRRHLNRSGNLDIIEATVYANLDTLVEIGLVEKGSQDGRTNAYTLTDEGQKALEGYRAYIGA